MNKCQHCGQILGKTHICPKNPSINLGKYSQKGSIPWNKGKTGVYSQETRYKMGASHRGKKRKPFSKETIEKMRLAAKKRNSAIWMKGNKHYQNNRELMIETRSKQVGEFSPNWKGGISTENNLIRNSKQGKEWRWNVFVRDHFTCQICGKVGGTLNADHIKPFSLYPELRFELTNGRTLCNQCHKTTESYGYVNSKKFAQL